ncbi:MAG: type VI secretion system ImpA family N-terminal domain-containing protein [Planctomycetes bacterium]|nr:type VI secretion system ImpA family N-terminal domain-containing protein [Planctomycetota bacterium]
MASAALLDFVALVAPIPGETPAGSSVPLTVRQKLESLRKEFEPHPDNPSLPPVPKKPDWQAIERMSIDTLSNTSKDLETAFRLTEALVKNHGVAGLRDGLHLLNELAAQCWERLHPMPDEGEGMEVRAERFYWMTEPDKGARFPNSVRAMPLVKVKDHILSYQDLQLAMRGQGTMPAGAFETAEPASGDVAEDLAQCVAELNQLELVLAEKCAPDPPAWTGLRHAMDECQNFMNKVLRRMAPADASANGAPGSGGMGGGDMPQAIASREEAYRQLGQIANVLEQLEPHSPIPYLLRRAIELGKMPFRQLIQEIVREPSLLAEVQREFGIKQGEGGSVADSSQTE